MRAYRRLTTYDAKHGSLVLSLLVSATDLIAWMALNVIGSGMLANTTGSAITQSVYVALLKCWNTIHFPINLFVLPRLLPQMQIHALGLADFVYVALCIAWTGLITYAAATLLGLLRKFWTTKSSE